MLEVQGEASEAGAQQERGDIVGDTVRGKTRSKIE